MTANSSPQGLSCRRLLFLDVDWTIIRPAATAVELWMAALETRQPEALPVLSREAPIEILLPQRDTPVVSYFRPRVVAALRQLPAELEIKWLSAWLTNIPQLRQLQAQLGIPADRIDVAELPPGVTPDRHAFPSSTRAVSHWKALTVSHVLRADQNVEVLWADDEVGHFMHHIFPTELQPRLHYVRPASWKHLLTETDLVSINRWATGTIRMLRQDKNTTRPFHGFAAPPWAPAAPSPAPPPGALRRGQP